MLFRSVRDAEAAGTDAAGGALLAEDESVVTLDTVTIEDPSATWGAGIDIDGGTAILTDLRVTGGVATEGGGARFHGGAAVSCERCTWDATSATEDGGAVVVGTGSSLEDLDGSWLGTIAAGSGGGLVLEGTASVTLDRPVFSACEAGVDGGAIAAEPDSTLAVSDGSFTTNLAAVGDGGALWSDGGVDLTDETFDGNTASRGAGGAVGATGTLAVDGTRFTDNTADDAGGAVYTEDSDATTLRDTVFYRNSAELLPSSVRVLGAVRDVMLAHPDIPYFLVEGHANQNGPDTYNLRLSDARAFSVMRWLAENGVPESRLLSKGFGEARPLAAGTDAEAMALNRRVEFRVVQVEDIPEGARRLKLPEEVRP